MIYCVFCLQRHEKQVSELRSKVAQLETEVSHFSCF